MRLELSKHLPAFESAVLTSRDEEGGYPYSARCHPVFDDPTGTLLVDLHPGAPVRPGRASLLCHRHDDPRGPNSFLVRGTLSREDRGWSFRPERFVPGAGIGGLVGALRFVFGSRRNVRRYLKRRGLARPRIPWEELDEIEAQAFREG